MRRLNHHRNVHAFNAAGLSHRPDELVQHAWNMAIGRDLNIMNHKILGDPLSTINAAVPGMGTPGKVRYYRPPMESVLAFDLLYMHQMRSFSGQLQDGDF